MTFQRKVKLALLGLAILIAIPAMWRVATSRPPASVFDGRSPVKIGRAWTISAAPEAPGVAFVDTTGSFQPGLHRYSVTFFVYDRDTRRLYSPAANSPRRAECSLMAGYLPAPEVRWRAGGFTFVSRVFVTEAQTCFASVEVRSGSRRPRNLVLYAAVLPYEVVGPFLGGMPMRWDARTRSVMVGDAVLLSCDREPDAFGMSLRRSRDRWPLVDITSYLRGGTLPRPPLRGQRTGDIPSSAVGFEMPLGPGESRRFTFRSPLEPVSASQWAKHPARRVSHDRALKDFRREWGREFGEVEIELPDRRFTDCFRASLAYLIALREGGLPRPGAAIYLPFWVRDFAYISDAFYAAGRADLIAPGIEQVLRMQNRAGGFTAKTGAVADDELDAPGQAIYVMVQDYRRTGDLARLKKYWPAIRAAVSYLRAKRSTTKNRILPPSKSAEDIGRADQQHYWDDFWAIRGLRDAVFAARKLGLDEEATEIDLEARVLTEALWTSVLATGAPYIPNGPMDMESSSMARGTSCAIVPCEALDASDPFVRSSFDEYWKRWIEPNDGGFVHKEHFWPYAGLDLAMDYLALGQPDRAARMLEWTIEHDSTGGFYSWPEGMNTADLSLAEGDMPHGWMCASYILLLRSVLARESGHDLLIASGVPASWLDPGKRIAVRDLPTAFGPVSYEIESHENRIEVNMSAGAQGRAFVVELPSGVKAAGASCRTVRIPAGTRHAVIHISR